MKISDVVKYVDFSKIDRNIKADLGEFETSLDTRTYLYSDPRFNERMSVQPIHNWICDDSMVGVLAYFFDGEFCALSFQSAGESDVEIFWKSNEIAAVVYNYITSLLEFNKNAIWLIDEAGVINWMEEKC